MILTLAAVPAWLTAVGIVFFLGICLGLILIVLIQRPQGGGLGGAFGGGAAGSGQTAFGAKTGDVLTWATISIFVLFLTIGALLNFALLPPKAVAPQLVPAGTTDSQTTTTPADANAPATSDTTSQPVPATGKPTGEPTNKPTNGPPEQPAGEPGAKPTPAPAQTPVEKPVQTPAEPTPAKPDPGAPGGGGA